MPCENAVRTEPRPFERSRVVALLFRQWRRNLVNSSLLLFLQFVAVALNVALPWAVGSLIGSVAEIPKAAGSTVTAWVRWNLMVGIYLASGGIGLIVLRISSALQTSSAVVLLMEGFARVQSYPSKWHEENFAGATAQKLAKAPQAYAEIQQCIFGPAGGAVLSIVGLLIVVALKWPVAACGAALSMAAFMVFFVRGQKMVLSPLYREHSAVYARISATILDALICNTAVKSFGMESEEERRLGLVARSYAEVCRKTSTSVSRLLVGRHLLMSTLFVLMTGGLLSKMGNGTVSPGDIAFGITTFLLLSAHSQVLSTSFIQLQHCVALLEPLATYVILEPTAPENSAARVLKPPSTAVGAAIHFRDVVFRYSPTASPIFDGLTVTISSGERVALVGPTGAGKSTFVKVLQRLYEIEGGSILINNINITAVTVNSLRRLIAIIPQDTTLFHRSVAENIAYGYPEASAEEVEWAARQANIHDLIMSLPQRYQTLVGERGLKFSGGERQRVAIARAFLAKAPILILDEATSALDVGMEKSIQRATERLMFGRTTVAITHRLSTIRNVDRILVMNDGKIIEQGTHDELLSSDGLYRSLVRTASAVR